MDNLIDPKTFADTYGKKMGLKYNASLNLFKSREETNFPSFRRGKLWYAFESAIDKWIASQGQRYGGQNQEPPADGEYQPHMVAAPPLQFKARL